MATPPAIVAILNWQHAHAGQVAYSETASTRLAFDPAHLTSTTDCSGMAIRMLRHFGGAAGQTATKGATYTGNLCRLGQLVTTHRAVARAGRGMLPGDLIFFTWSGHNAAFDHVAIYAGSGRIWNHGGPGRGPLNWSLADNVNSASEVMVRRYLTSAPVPPAPKPAPNPPSTSMLDTLKGRPMPFLAVTTVDTPVPLRAWYVVDGGKLTHIATPADARRFAARFGAPVAISEAQYREMGGTR